jgi:hypothetical protein
LTDEVECPFCGEPFAVPATPADRGQVLGHDGLAALAVVLLILLLQVAEDPALAKGVSELALDLARTSSARSRASFPS